MPEIETVSSSKMKSPKLLASEQSVVLETAKTSLHKIFNQECISPQYILRGFRNFLTLVILYQRLKVVWTKILQVLVNPNSKINICLSIIYAEIMAVDVECSILRCSVIFFFFFYSFYIIPNLTMKSGLFCATVTHFRNWLPRYVIFSSFCCVFCRCNTWTHDLVIWKVTLPYL